MKGLAALLKDGALNRLSVDEIMEFGYPREVAERIASGELPMDEASRAARIAEGETFSPVLWRGHDWDNPPDSNSNMWMSDDWDMSETYAGDGEVTPLRHNAKNLFELDAEGEWHEDIYAEPWMLPGVNLDDINVNLNGTEGISHTVERHGVHQGSLFRNIKDDKYPPTEYTEEEMLELGLDEDDLFSGNVGNVYNILGERPEVKIRHRDAAYDPKYNGPNIMGATAAGAIGLGALTQSEDAEAIFLGTGARNAPLDMLGMAKTMKGRGVPREEIHNKTGWHQGTDGKWRFEINDNKMFLPGEGVMKTLPDPKPGTIVTMENGGLNVDRDYKYSLGNERIGWGINPRDYTGVTGGAEMINYYPAMAHVDIPSTKVPDPVDVRKGNGGYFHGDGTATKVPPLDEAVLFDPRWNDSAHTGMELEDGTRLYLENPKTVVQQIYAPQAAFSAVDGKRQAERQYQSVLAHETQHAVQHLEGFNRGGSDTSAVLDARKYANDEVSYISEKYGSKHYPTVDDVNPLIDAYDEALQRRMRLQGSQGDVDTDLLSFEQQSRLDDAINDIEFLETRFPYLPEAHKRFNESIGRLKRAERAQRSEGRLFYKNLAGEVEARNDQYRLKLTDEERRNIPPWETEDVPREKQYAGVYASNPFTPRYSPEPYGFASRMAAENVLPQTQFANEVQDLERAGMDRLEAAALVNDQIEYERNILDRDMELYTDWRTATPEQQAEMLAEAERVATANPGLKNSPFAAGRATVPGMVAAGAGGGVLATAAANLASLFPDGTVDAVSELGVVDSGVAAADTAVRAGQGFLNDLITGGTMVTNAVADEDYEPYEVDIDPGTEQGDTLVGGLMEDMGRLFDYKGIMGNMPSATEMISGGIDLYNEYISPYMNDRVEEGLGGAAILGASLPFIPGRSTIRGAERKDYPGIYQEPGALLEQVEVEPETGVLEEVFGVTRQDLADIGRTRQGNEAPALPGAAAKPKGTAHGEKITKPANTGRLVNALENAMGSELEKGMSGWYVMDPLYDAYRSLGLSEEEAARRFKDFQAFTGIHSSASDVKTELTRGTGALYLNEQGRMDDYVNYGGKVGQPGAPEDMSRFPGHFAHKTAHGTPLLNYIENGALTMKSPKVPLYIQSAGVPETGFQTEMPVGDAHFSRAIGLADVRPSKTMGATNESWTTPEAQQLTPWWRDEVAGQVDLESVPAQALAWGLFSPQTGVDTPVGVPKLEILAQMIAERARERGIPIEQARDEILMAQDYVSSLSTK
jgi:hypothetical protein